ncbi:MAG TPA: M28 family peptidase [Ferruginibacter sp.]|nr:M28 family peptidase [Ferruginibacter sp.]HMP19959.1 M28 family peptidase [Ferruginibacter sp.]
MKHFYLLLLLSIQFTYAQKLNKKDRHVINNLQEHVNYLASDKLEGRRAGTTGEQLAYTYISAAFEKAGLEPKGTNGYLQAFEINEGKMVNPSSHLIINGHDLKLHKDFFPLAYSPNTSLEATGALALHESGSPWFFDIKELLEANAHNPHFDVREAVKTQALAAAQKGAAAFIICNTSGIEDGLKFEPKDKSDITPIPVLYIASTGKQKCLNDETMPLDIQLKVMIEDKKRYGHNVAAFINNHAPTTVVLGAHYDHLGYGEDNNSLYAGEEKMIHNGADDNASGTAALIELGNMLKNAKLKNNNYLLIAFSGEELGLYGSKFFADNPTVDLSVVNYMLNMDMVGRLNDSTHALTVGGYGTSPLWADAVQTKHKYFTVKIDSSGTGPSDHTSFYRKDIPVLFFFTGLHSDYHKPGDDAEKINYSGELQVVKFVYSIIERLDKSGKIPFTKTREAAMGSKTSFKVTLGIMPDYTYSGSGVRADGVSEGKIAQKAGIKAGDVLLQLGQYSFTDVETYMQALSKFKKGDATTVKVKRGNDILSFDIIF